MTDRRRRIVLLLGTLNDLLPAPKGSLRTTPGLAGAERVNCNHCDPSDRGWTTDRFKRRTPCQPCGGKVIPTGRDGNWLKRDGGRGWVMVDPMDADRRPVQTATEAAPPTRPPRMVICDACGGTGAGRWHVDPDTLRERRDPCVRCTGSGKRSVAFPLALTYVDDEGDAGVEAALMRRDAQGSYAELDRALAKLPSRLRGLVLDVHANTPPRIVGPLGERLLEAAMVQLDHGMPEPIRVPAGVLAAARNEQLRLRTVRGRGLDGGRADGGKAMSDRDKQIRTEARKGRPIQWIAQTFGLSVSRTYAIIAGEARDAAA